METQFVTKLLAAADGFQEQGNASLIGDIIRTKITKWQMPRLMYGTQTQMPRLMFRYQDGDQLFMSSEDDIIDLLLDIMFQTADISSQQSDTKICCWTYSRHQFTAVSFSRLRIEDGSLILKVENRRWLSKLES